MTIKTRIHTLLAAGAACAAALVAVAAGPAVATPTHTHSLSYGWPVKPFDRQHPVRGGFGDPRTIFFGPPSQRTLLRGGGVFQFHDGVDISAPDGSPVYPVADGTVVKVTDQMVDVDSGGRSFAYWHIVASVGVGAHVTTDRTVLGHIIPGCRHVHLSEYDAADAAVNPLQAGHLTPYTDTTKPVVTGIALRTSVTGADLMPELVRGRIEPIASVHDTPSMAVPGVWHDLPVSPALVEWWIRQPGSNGKVVVPLHVAFDVREHLPANRDLWAAYARGSHQNMSVFGQHYSFLQPGVYEYRLAPGGFDTRTLKDSVYELVVKAVDIRGNATTAFLRFSVHNAPGVVGI
jgi:hypothetical protein